MLDAVLPLTLADLDRFQILARSIAANFSDLTCCWVIVPDAQFGEMERAMPHARFRAVRESEIVPELANCRAKGWFKQQLVKLAMAEHVSSDYYLLFDADVICARPIRSYDLFRDGKALCHRYQSGNHTKWYRWAERVLGMKRTGWVHGVTPTVLSKHAVRELTDVLNHQSPRPLGLWSKLRGLGHRWLSKPQPIRRGRWRQVLLESLPWTEYALYFTFLEATGKFDRYHAHAERSLCGDCLWRRDGFSDWQPAARRHFRDPPFIVVQSITKIPPALIEQRIEPLLRHSA